MVEAEINNKENEEVEPNFDDPPGYNDPISDEELLGDVLRQEPLIDEYEENCLVVFGIPSVTKEKLAKLQTVMSKILNGINPNHVIEYPSSGDGSTKGCLFVEWENKETAQYALTVLNGYKLDKVHTFSAITIADMKNMPQPDENWEPPKPNEYANVGDLWSWMQNPRCRDQFSVQYENSAGPTVSIFWHVKGHEPEVAEDGSKPNWTESVFKWTPHGSYLATIHNRGIALWGGPKFQRYMRFEHLNVQYFDFSPCETYMVTYAPSNAKWDEDENCLQLWDVRTGEMRKGFSLYALTLRNELEGWPFFQWSHDDKFFACLKVPEKDKLEKQKKVNGIAVYDAETLQLVSNRYIVIENIRTFSWAPGGKNIIAYYSESTEQLPAEFGLISMPTGEKLRSARIYNVAEAQMFWQESGMRLAVHNLRYNKRTFKENGEVKFVGAMTSHIEIFELTGKKDVALMNLPLSEAFINFGWEPNGDKFCVLIGNQAKATPFVYRIDAMKHTPVCLGKLDAGVQLNTVSFAPQGGWLVVMACMSTGGNILFIDTNGQEAKRTSITEHPGFNKGYWDPTGRYFVSCCTVGCRVGADLGYRLYTFQGRELLRKNLERMMQFKWRPRPPVKLSEQKVKEIRKNLKTTSAKFDREDNEEKVKASQEVIDKRRKIMLAFDIIRKKNHALIEKQKDERKRLRNGVDTEADLQNEDLVEETITVALSTQKTLAVLSEEDERD
ncbi:unnamed protein product, partial [Mesorhabditis belari]|uniref:Eukaryotic translation initiation factor 3 subunit B n=1 Tax=Mesorhabditis belari TaxID=2138241 RepID=A0AAF3EY47_9BILA